MHPAVTCWRSSSPLQQRHGALDQKCLAHLARDVAYGLEASEDQFPSGSTSDSIASSFWPPILPCPGRKSNPNILHGVIRRELVSGERARQPEARHRRTVTVFAPEGKDATGPKEMLKLFFLLSEATMSAHAFEVLSRARMPRTATASSFLSSRLRRERESYLNQSRLLAKKALPIRRGSFPAVLALLPLWW